MSYRFFLWAMRVLIGVSFLALMVFVVFLSPYDNSNQNIILANVIIFETSLFMGLFAGFSLLLFWLRTFKLKNPRKKELDAFVGASVRQGFLLALIFLFLLIMQSFDILVWWDGLLVVGAVILVELYFLAR
jgi:hypothetical protein